jgi:hypothetical protein
MDGSPGVSASVTGDRGRIGTRPAALLARRSDALPTRVRNGTPNPNDVARGSAIGGAGAGGADVRADGDGMAPI